MKRVLGIVIMVAGCYSPNVSNGQLKCSSDGKCPEGFHCAADKTCWKNGQDPMPVVVDMSQLPDLTQPPVDMTPDAAKPMVLPHAGTAVLSGGVTATSEHYKIIMSTGQAPGGNANAASTTTKSKKGVAGVTQGK